MKLRGAFLIGMAFGVMCGLFSAAYVMSSSAQALTSSCGARVGEAQLLCVTRETNKAIVATDDFDHYGIADVWVEDPVDGKGDCEDFVLTKARVLQQLGWKPSRMQLAVFGYGKQAHAVLLIDDKYVLDNLTPWVGRWKGYGPRAIGVYPIEVARSLPRFTPGLMTASIAAG
ncbi:transglutaminase-like cysteine peptidase [Caulobacter sp.]|uniref:transglutaminase-like cysteine peptidase n=1 Tax=Caulobacter sp. TaxID=78 RepID=UPI003BAF13D2